MKVVGERRERKEEGGWEERQVIIGWKRTGRKGDGKGKKGRRKGEK